MATLETSQSRAAPLGAYAALVAGAVAMGASPIFVRLAEVGPFASAFWRVVLAIPVLWAWDRTARGPAEGPLFAPILLWAGLFFAGDLFFWHLAIRDTTVANATFFATTAPIWVVIVSWGVFRERIEGTMLIGLVLALAGGATLIGESLDVAPGRITGDVFGILTAFFFGLYFLAVRAARRTHGSARVTFVSTLVTAAVLGIVVLISGEPLLPRTMNGVAALVALALVSHIGGQGLLAFALGYLPATFSSLVIFLEAVAAAAFGWIVLSEALSSWQILGGVVIVLGIWIARPRAVEAA